ncbi:MAG: endonuclease/exonuclease/phosphatase family protein [Acidobacteriota bacterium]
MAASEQVPSDKKVRGFARSFVLLTALLLASLSCRPADNELWVLWWNVENLFDTVDDPTRDDDFTPEGRLAWTEKRLRAKFDSLALTVRDLPALPPLVALCEVEHKDLVETLFHQILERPDYRVTAFESPDERGIDVALAWDPAHLRQIDARPVAIALEGDTTRDILAATFERTESGDRLYVFANHWPSRRNPPEVRMQVAQVLRREIDLLLENDPVADILVLGDLNDEPEDPSVTEGLRAFTERQATAAQPGALFNLWGLSKVPGTYVYRDDWNRLDHIIVSPGLLDRQGYGLPRRGGFRVLRSDRLLREGEPFRTYSRGKHQGGPSDHLPLLVRLREY